MTSRAERRRNERRQQEELRKAGLLLQAAEDDPAAKKKKKKKQITEKGEKHHHHDKKKKKDHSLKKTTHHWYLFDMDLWKHYAMCALYISSNFVWFWTPLTFVLYIYYKDKSFIVNVVGSSFMALQILDLFVIPFNVDIIDDNDDKDQKDQGDDHNKTPCGYWPWFCWLTDNTCGIIKNNNAEIIVEDFYNVIDDKHQQHELDPKTNDFVGKNRLWVEGSRQKQQQQQKDPSSSLSDTSPSSSYYQRDKNYLLCYFPHSLYPAMIFPLGRYFKEVYGIDLLYTGADVIFQIPILRRLMAWWGCTKVSKEALQKSLTKLHYPYNMILLTPDGIQGMFYGLRQEQVVLQKRKGFCKIALRTGASLVPCYVMGANQLYDRWWGPNSVAAWLSHKFHVSLVFWTDRFGIPFGFIPKPVKMIAVVGKPIDVTKVENPTNEKVIELHTKFINEIKALYDRHKHRMGVDWAKKYNRLYLEDEQPGNDFQSPKTSTLSSSVLLSSSTSTSPTQTNNQQ